MISTTAIRRIVFYVFFLFLFFSVHAQKNRVVLDFDSDWRFLKGDTANAEQASFNDANWRSLNVPHDWSIEGPYDRSNATGRGGGYLPAGVGWYRKTFSVPDAEAGKRFFTRFDGVMANSDVWINGHHLGKRPNGYVAFEYELTPYLQIGAGKKNVLTVRVDNSVQPASRWYTGAGIYRHVRLVSVHPVHIKQWGHFISARDVTTNRATVHVQTEFTAPATVKKLEIQTTLIAPDGKPAATAKQTIDPSLAHTLVQKIDLTNPALWDIESPQLYKAITKLIADGKETDEVISNFGIRDARFDAATGFWLNGKNLKIKGVCLHHDGGAVGAAVPLRIWEKRLLLLKEVGVNGIRTAHNPMSSEFLDLCDRLGFVVMNETFDTWNAAKNNAEKGYNLYFTGWWERDTRNIVMNDRNHPSIVIYSVGNEIRDNLNDTSGFRKYRMQQDLIHELDGTRPVTMALFRPGSSRVYENGFAEIMDVVGQNYREAELVAAHESKPSRKVIGTENGHELNAWLILRDKPYMAGQFLWTGIEYLGESDWPRVTNGSGFMDKTGELKNNGYQRQSWWSNKPMVHVMRSEGNTGSSAWVSDWTPSDFDTYDEAGIQVFSNCDEVELFLNDKSLGVKQMPADKASSRTWTTTFQKGILKAVGRNNGKQVAEQVLRTAGQPAKIVLTIDKPDLKNDWDDVVFVTANIVDENGTPVRLADNKISFSINGPGVIAAVDNANLSSTEPFQAKERLAYRGKCVAIIKASADKGKIIVTASADNLASGTVSIDVSEKK